MWLTIRDGPQAGALVDVVGDRYVIGRDPTCDLRLDDVRVSRIHASLQALPDGRALVQDLGSTNGTLVNGRFVSGSVLLDANDVLQVGSTRLWASRERPVTGATVAGPVPDAITQLASPPLPTSSAPPLPPPPQARPQEGGAGRRSSRVAVIVAAAAVVVALALGGTLFAVLAGGGDGGSRQAATTPDRTGTSSPAPTALSIPDVIKAVSPSVVSISTFADGKPFSGGSGWVLDADRGLIVTNGHVVNEATSVKVGVDGELRAAQIVGVAPCEDVAVLQVADTTGLRTIALGSQRDLQQGETVVALGFPENASGKEDLTATTGIVSVAKTEFRLRALDVPRYRNVVQTDAAINPGNSGGPLVDQSMNLIGMNSAGITLLGGRTIQGQGYAIGVDRLKAVTEVLRDGHSLAWTGMGLGYPTRARQLTRLGLPPVSGLLVRTAVPGTPADRAGFGTRPELVVRIDGRRVFGDLPSYCRVTKGIEGGERAGFDVFDGGPGRGARRVPVRFVP